MTMAKRDGAEQRANLGSRCVIEKICLMNSDKLTGGSVAGVAGRQHNRSERERERYAYVVMRAFIDREVSAPVHEFVLNGNTNMPIPQSIVAADDLHELDDSC